MAYGPQMGKKILLTNNVYYIYLTLAKKITTIISLFKVFGNITENILLDSASMIQKHLLVLCY